MVGGMAEKRRLTEIWGNIGKNQYLFVYLVSLHTQYIQLIIKPWPQTKF
jgi:hypothetical protein